MLYPFNVFKFNFFKNETLCNKKNNQIRSYMSSVD